MRDRLIYILKHNRFIQTAYKLVMSVIFRLLGVFIPVDEKLVLISSFMGKGVNDSPKVIYDYIRAHLPYQKLRCVWALENPKATTDVETVKIDTLAYFVLALKAKYWITNTNIERGLRFKKRKQVYLNTWHGTALKLIGNDCPGRKDYNFDTVDFLVVSGEYDERVWKSAFNARESSFLRCGMPRNEELWSVDECKKKEIRKKLNIPVDKKVILYAPTWRDSTDGGKSYTIKPPINFDLWKKELGKEYVVLFRAHHQTTKVLGLKNDEFVLDASTYPRVNDLMIASDVLITDYSAIAFDFSILCRPIFCYAYDYDEYLTQRGTYFSIDEYYPNKSCRTETELLERLKSFDYQEECINTKRFREKFVEYGIGATETCVKAVFEQMR